ncbi:MAG: 6,7-dimethyl-8-ribityllumazine synthase [Rhodospirillaceae bacterium]|jgi:6,7-dimethyl-8-ribityllumazine synthase|nr:6,7-dimethyl-8-ribityllumazine synthase [Rhodospirillaceae bacterium]MBT5244998.1 6,7-dimethyl-8-ribityllumazine synthase [Rhodospirillaceae bacterium]MBT5561116.1 6,7-dimethyl-8-ribityllumazine synthase [Rhodospirillaceae bacterium]MBT6240999.1 6,7-dimethyl-8-ribityllumazine synthase [Rhodospirillaceae bacterium]
MSETPSVLIVEGRFYDDIADELARGAAAVLDEAGMNYERLAVPGAFEVPQAIRFAIRSMEIGSAMSRYAGFIGFGCVIRGETSHYDYVCQESTRALMDIAMKYSVALGYGILTVENRDQAWERADVSKKNKGGDVASACLRMMDVKKHFRLVPR